MFKTTLQNTGNLRYSHTNPQQRTTAGGWNNIDLISDLFLEYNISENMKNAIMSAEGSKIIFRLFFYLFIYF